MPEKTERLCTRQDIPVQGMLLKHAQTVREGSSVSRRMGPLSRFTGRAESESWENCMAEKIQINRNQVKTLLDTRFVKVFDLQYAEGKHYYDATRRDLDHLTAVKDDEAFQAMIPDAVSCFVIVETKDAPPKLLLNWEYRYTAGQFLLSVPAGLIDPEDAETACPALTAAAREIQEETGLQVCAGDSLTLVSPLVFSTPGLSDESNALACAVLHPENLDGLNQTGAVGSEMFDGFKLVDENEAKKLIRDGRDEHGVFLPLYTWAGLMWFVSGMWKS